jgi:hypothetical protein
VAYGNGIFVINGFQSPSTSSLLTSPDGISWTTQSPLPIKALLLTFGGGNFVGAGGDVAHGIPGYIWSSSDGTNWVQRKSGIGATLWNVKYVAGTFMAVGENGTILQTGFSSAVPEISQQPASQTVIAGSNATFTVFACGSPPLIYQWFFNGTNLLAGATNSSLTLSNMAWIPVLDLPAILSPTLCGASRGDGDLFFSLRAPAARRFGSAPIAC